MPVPLGTALFTLPALVGGAEYLRRYFLPPDAPTTRPAPQEATPSTPGLNIGDLPALPQEAAAYSDPVQTTLDRLRAAASGGSRSPVVTPGQATATATATDQPADPNLPTTPPESPGETTPPEEGMNSNLARFGFAMAASRNPSLFGQIGEAGLSMLTGHRENREDTRRERELNITEIYRQAQIELSRAEQEWARDPTNPRNIALLAEARYRLAAAARAASGGGGGGGAAASERITSRGLDAEGNAVGYTRDGRVVYLRGPDGAERFQPAEGIDRLTQAWEARRDRRLSDLERQAQTQPALLASPQAREQFLMRGLSEWERMNPRPGPGNRPMNSQPPTQATQAPANVIRIPLNR